MRDSKDIEIGPETSIREAIRVIDQVGIQIALVVDGERTLLGTVTDGDVRRGILAGRELAEPVRAIMHVGPRTAGLGEGRSAILALMRQRRIHQVPIVDAAGRVLGIQVLDELLSPEALPNQVVILAGGRGRRLHPITEDIPKPLVKVGDRPILERIVQGLAEHGFRRIALAVNYKAGMIERHFGDGGRFGVEISYLREDAPLGTAGALGLLPAPPSEPFLVMNGDLLTAVNPRALLDAHARSGAEATMCVRDYEVSVPYGVVEMDGDRFVRLNEKPVERYFVNAGIYLLSPSALDVVERGVRLDMPVLFERLTKAGRRARVFPIREYWLDIGQLPDLERARSDVAEVFEEGS